MHKNPIVVVDDDADDLELIQSVIEDLKLPNDLHFFSSGKELYTFLKKSEVSPFLILCDVNIPGEDGFAIREKIESDKDIFYKSVPFIFWSTSASEQQIKRAYDNKSQGFFFKPSSYAGLTDTVKALVHYWTLSQHPKQL